MGWKCLIVVTVTAASAAAVVLSSVVFEETLRLEHFWKSLKFKWYAATLLFVFTLMEQIYNIYINYS